MIGDLTIILDGTRHITEPNFSKQKEFIVHVLDKFLIKPDSLEVWTSYCIEIVIRTTLMKKIGRVSCRN